MVIYKLICLLILCYTTMLVAEQNLQCGDWEAYKDVKCFKVLHNEEVKSYENAKNTCYQYEASSLVTIHSVEEQEFLFNLLKNVHNIVNDVWIGGHYKETSLKWTDNTTVNYTNWANDNPRNDSGYECIKIAIDEPYHGKWLNEPCSRDYAFVCQKLQTYLQTNNFWPEVFYIPQPGETIAPTSYISMRVTIESYLYGQLMVIDERSGQQLLSYSKTQNVFPRTPYIFTSDSNKVRIEMRLPPDNNADKQVKTISMPNSSTTKTGRIIKIYDKLMSVLILYIEVPFSEHTVELEADLHSDHYREAIYMQNSAITYILLRKGRESVRGVLIILESLDIEIGSGDFIQIGPGNRPDLSKAQLIATNIHYKEQKKLILVDADSAYIRLVTHKSLNTNRTALRFSWTPPPEISGIVEDKEKSPEDKKRF